MTVHRTADEQDWRDHDEGLYDPDAIVEREREHRIADLRDMSYPLIAVERIKPAAPQPEFEPPVRTVRAHEVRSYGRMTVTEWIFLIGAGVLLVGWVCLLAAVMYAVTVG